MSFKFNPFTGTLDLVTPPNFSYDKILTGSTVTIPLNQQMVVSETIEIDGTLVLDGTLVVI